MTQHKMVAGRSADTQYAYIAVSPPPDLDALRNFQFEAIKGHNTGAVRTVKLALLENVVELELFDSSEFTDETILERSQELRGLIFKAGGRVSLSPFIASIDGPESIFDQHARQAASQEDMLENATQA